MENSQLIAVLKTFSAKEIRDFKRWLASPFHNQRKDVIQLFNYLIKNDHLNDKKYLAKEKIFKKIFPKEPYDDAKMRQTMHFLLKQVEDYISYCQLQKDEIRKEIALSTSFRVRNLNKQFEKKIDHTILKQNSKKYKDSNYLYNNYLLQEEKFKYLAETNRTSKTNLQESSDALDKSYIANRLKQSCIMLGHKRVSKIEYHEGLVLDAINYAENNNLLNVPAISIYYYIYQTYTRPEEEYFFKLKDTIFTHGHLFSTTEINDVILLALNYCMSKQHQGKHQFVQELFDLYKYGFSNGMFIENGTLPKLTFINAMINCIILREFEWGENFLSTYSKYLDPAERENIIHFCKGKLLFQKMAYDEAMDEFSLVKENDILLNLSSKHSLLKIYYKQDYHDLMLSLSGSMSKYIQRKDVSETHRKVYESIIRLMKKLVKVNPYSKPDIKKLRTEIEQTATLPYSEKEWLLEQVDEL